MGLAQLLLGGFFWVEKMFTRPSKGGLAGWLSRREADAGSSLKLDLCFEFLSVGGRFSHLSLVILKLAGYYYHKDVLCCDTAKFSTCKLQPFGARFWRGVTLAGRSRVGQPMTALYRCRKTESSEGWEQIFVSITI